MMKNVDVMQVRAMLKEILAADRSSVEDIKAVLTIGTPAMGSKRLGGPLSLKGVLRDVEQAAPASQGAMRISNDSWDQLESVYSRSVVEPLFA